MVATVSIVLTMTVTGVFATTIIGVTLVTLNLNIPFVGQGHTVQTQISRRIHLIRTSTVCLKNVLFKFDMTQQPLNGNELVQFIRAENAILLN